MPNHVVSKKWLSEQLRMQEHPPHVLQTYLEAFQLHVDELVERLLPDLPRIKLRVKPSKHTFPLKHLKKRVSDTPLLEKLGDILESQCKVWMDLSEIAMHHAKRVTLQPEDLTLVLLVSNDPWVFRLPKEPK